MKSVYLVAALSAFCGVEATSKSTVICNSCPPASSTPDMVTRSDAPTTPCTAPPLTVVPSPGMNSSMTMTWTGTGGMPTSTGSPVPSDVPVAAGSKMGGSLGGAAALAAAAVYLM